MVGHPHEDAACSYCDKVVEEQTVAKYFKVKQKVEEVLAKDEIPTGTAIHCLNLMTGLFNPYDLTYISTCQMAITDCILQNRLKEGLEFAQIMFEVSRRLVRRSPAQVELVLRMMRLQAELRLKEDLEELVEKGLSDAHGDVLLCSQILLYKKLIMNDMFTQK